ncbi:ethanolamine utilization protein EutN [bacterium]|nr:MAG: ethanolamine utilization protein EutN [bacterium]
MKLGKIIGKLFCTIADPKLDGVKLYVIQPLDSELNPMGKSIVAADGVGSQEGQIVFWVSAREATLCIQNREIPVDAGIVGIVDAI